MKSPARLITFYVAFFMAVGITLPFIPGYLKSLGLPGHDIGVLLAVAPALALVMPPLWGQLTDRLGRPGVVLLLQLLGTLGGYALLLECQTFWTVLGALAVQAAFSSGITTVADSMALRHVAQHGGTYAGIRAWGSFGFVCSALAFGLLVPVIDRRTVWAAIGLLGVTAVWVALRLWDERGGYEGPRPTVDAALGLLRQPGVALFLLATALHWVAAAPYHGLLTIHLTALGHPPAVVSYSSAVAVAFELLAMVTWSRWSGRLSTSTLLAVAFGASALRWWGIAVTDSAWGLVALSSIHGLTFGAFYLAAVTWMAQRAPDSLARHRPVALRGRHLRAGRPGRLHRLRAALRRPGRPRAVRLGGSAGAAPAGGGALQRFICAKAALRPSWIFLTSAAGHCSRGTRTKVVRSTRLSKRPTGR